MKIDEILKMNKAVWRAKPSASAEVLKTLRDQAEASLSEDYLHLLRLCDGGAGWTANQAEYFMIYAAEIALQLNSDSDYPGYFIIGSDGSAGRLAFKMDSDNPASVHLFDSFEPELIHKILAESFADFLSTIVVPESASEAESA